MESLMGYFIQEMAASSLIAEWGKQTVFHLKTDTILNFKRSLNLNITFVLKCTCVCVGRYVCRLHYLCAGWLKALRHPFGRQRWGLERRIVGWACFVDGALVPAAPCTGRAVELWPAGRRCCAQTQAPGRCRCCQPDRNGRRPPGRKERHVKNWRKWWCNVKLLSGNGYLNARWK